MTDNKDSYVGSLLLFLLIIIGTSIIAFVGGVIFGLGLELAKYIMGGI